MRKNGFKKDRSAGTCHPTDAISWACLNSPSSPGRLELSCWVAGLGIATNSCKKIAFCHKRAIVESIVKEAIFTQACTNVTRLRVCCLITRLRSWFKFHRITKGSYNYWKRLISPYSDKALHEFYTCMQTNTTGFRFYKDSLECFVQLVFASKWFYTSDNST